MEISQDTSDFIARHSNTDPRALRLKFAGKTVSGVDLPFALTQIEARRKAAGKLPWLATDRMFVFPDTLSAEQCTAQPIADMHAEIAALTAPDGVLDLTCGLGIDALALAGVASSVDACEISAAHVEAVKHNIAVRECHNLKVHHCSAEDFLQSVPSDCRYSLIFADPARRDSSSKRTYAFEDCSPDILRLMPCIQAHTDRLLIKASPMLDVAMTLKQLPALRHVYVISLRNECKELLCDCRFEAEDSQVCFTAINILPDGKQHFSFSASETGIPCPCLESADNIEPGQWLFEPNASVMKLIGIAPFHSRWPEMRKLAPNTHIYIGSGNPPADLPGRVCRIEEVVPYHKKYKGSLSGRRFNVVSRNFPATPDEVKRKFKLLDGGDSFLYCVTLSDAAARLIIAVPV